MLTLRKSNDRGHADHGWLKALHSFSFASYFDPRHMGWGNLRVINEDRVAAHRGFGMHGHKDMEIVTYIVQGALEHKDSLGNGETIRPGDVQRMSAGTGVMHSEMNPTHETTHLLQIWIEPSTMGIPASYEQKTLLDSEKRGVLKCVAAPAGDAGVPGVVTIHADARLYAGLFNGDENATLFLADKRKAYVQLVRGALNVNGQVLQAGDAALLDDEKQITLSQGQDAEVLVFDLTP